MVVAIFVFAPIGLPAWYWLLLTRIVGVPLIAGISFELIKLGGKHRSAAGSAPSCGPASSSSTSPPANPTAPSSPSPSPRSRPSSRPSPTSATTDAEDLIGVEVVA